MLTALVCFVYYLILAFLFYYAARYVWELIPVTGLDSKTVFISGCDTGFGRLLALKCAKNGITVFAGCYSTSSEESIVAESDGFPGKIIPVSLDITCDESVQTAAKLVKSKLQPGQTLWALVNNAGAFTSYGPDAWTTIDEYKWSLDVNAFGHIRCVHAFLPLLKQSKGRIITVTSVAGRVSVPCGAPYAMAKFATEAYMDAIRQELKPYNITCCILEPQVFSTNLINKDALAKRVDQVWSKLDNDVKKAYGEEYKKNFVTKWNASFHDMASPHLHYVVDDYYHAITARFPRYRYRCGWYALLVFIPLSYLPTGLEDWIFELCIGKTALPAELENVKSKVQ